MTLDGMEQAVHRAVPRRSRVNFIRYADDFIITGKSKTILENNVVPAVKAFLAERGLQLSAEKTRVTRIADGFTFLGQTFRKYGRVLRITPSKESVLSLIRKVGAVIRKYVSAPMEGLIKKLNQMLRGWANYHRHVVSSEVFRRVDTYVYEQLWRMLRRRHHNRSRGWLIRQYWTTGGQKWRFGVKRKVKHTYRVYQVMRVSAIGIKRHIKVRSEANPYMPEYGKYFADRRHNRAAREMRELTMRAQKRAMINEVNRRAAQPGKPLLNA
jgi:RNA-directed DNA polymerase